MNKVLNVLKSASFISFSLWCADKDSWLEAYIEHFANDYNILISIDCANIFF